MDYAAGDFVCTSTNWSEDGDWYQAEHVVTVSVDDDVEFPYLIESVKIRDEKSYELAKQSYKILNEKFSKGEIDSLPEAPGKDHDQFMKGAFRLQNPVVDWLQENVLDAVLEDKTLKKAWCTGGLEYTSADFSFEKMDIFFVRKSDAMNFIEQFSHYQKPIDYLDKKTGFKASLNIDCDKYLITMSDGLATGPIELDDSDASEILDINLSNLNPLLTT